METNGKKLSRFMSIVQTKKFIEAFKNEPCLWKQESPYYGHTREMNQAYLRLAAFLQNQGVDADRDYVVNKLETLNNCWKIEYNKIHKPSNGFKYKTTLWYYDLLSFAFADGPDIPEYKIVSQDNKIKIVNENETGTVIHKCKVDVLNPKGKPDIILNNTSNNESGEKINEAISECSTDVESQDFSEKIKLENDALATIRDHNETVCLFRKSISDVSEAVNLDNYDAFGLIVAQKFRKIGNVSSKQQVMCENILNNLLIGALRGQLTDTSEIMF